MRTFTSLVLSGGGVKCLSAIGCVQFFEEKKQMHHFRNFIGTSGGSMMCLCLCLGYTCNEIIEFVNRSFAEDDIITMDANEILGLLTNYGVNSGTIINKLTEKIIYEKIGVYDINFIDLAKRTGKNLVVCVANLTRERDEFFCVDTTPELSVVTAIRVSCSIPMIFTPITINDDVYLDGGIYNNFPIDYLKGNTVKDIFGINIISKCYQKTDNFLDYTKFIMFSIIEKLNKKNINDKDRNIVTLEFDGSEPFISSANFRITVSKEQVATYVKFGYKKTKEVLCGTIPA